jgi:lysyl endopeptidase
LIAESATSDFTLIRLQQTPSSQFKVYYAGWDVRGLESSCGAGIHHPSGHEKRISFYSDPISKTRTSINGSVGAEIETWRVVWSSGVTEPGSSGSGLWNMQHQLVGVLSGGGSACGNPTAPDFYGRLDVAWDTEPSSSQQLKAHLDPDNRGIKTVPGRDPDLEPLPLDTVTSTACSGDGDGGGGGALPGPLAALLLAAALLRLGFSLRNRA